MTNITDIYKAQGIGDREIEVRDKLAALYSLPFGEVQSQDRIAMRDLHDELIEFIAARKLMKI